MKNWKTGVCVWGEPVSVRDVHFKPLGPKGPQMTATVFDATGSRIVKSWNLPAAQVTLLVTAATEATLQVRISGMVEAAAYGALMLYGVTPVDP